MKLLHVLKYITAFIKPYLDSFWVKLHYGILLSLEFYSQPGLIVKTNLVVVVRLKLA